MSGGESNLAYNASPSEEQLPAAKGRDYGAITPTQEQPPFHFAQQQNTAMGPQKSSIPQTTKEKPPVVSVVEEYPDDDHPCAWGPLEPPCCQMCRTAKCVLLILCIAAVAQGMIVNGFVNVVISTIEKRFELSSTESGLIVSCYDIASLLCLIPVSYFGGRGRKSRWLGTGVFVIGLGSFIFTLPHFITDQYNYHTTREENVCYPDGYNDTDICDSDENPDDLNKFKYVFMLGNFLHGAGSSPLYTLGVTYLDENLKTKMAPFYLGIFYAMAIIGPAFGYLLGGEFLKIFTDFETVDIDTVTIDTESTSWVGAWWIGFLMAGCMAVCISIPLCGFPFSMPGSAKIRAEKVSEVHKGSDVTACSTPVTSFGIKDLWRSFKIIFTNPTFIFLNLSGACEGLLVNGFSAFTPKYIEAQFGVTAGWAAQLVGFAAIPAGGGGTFLGGFIVKKFELKMRGILRLCVGTAAVSFVLVFCFLIRCPGISFAGLTVPYEANGTLLSENLTSSCNMGCHCLRDRYDPVCGINDVMYFSPCHAGCLNESEVGDTTVYANCGCIEQPPSSNEVFTATLDKCDSGCMVQMAAFLVLFGLVMLFTFTTSMPALSASLRCVPERERSLAVGVQWVFVRLLGTIPAPPLFGSLIDKTCLLWEDRCGEDGACYYYDNSDQSTYLMVLGLVFKGLSVVFLSLAMCVYCPPPSASNGMTGSAIRMSSNANIIGSSTPGEVRGKQNGEVGRGITNSAADTSL